MILVVGATGRLGGAIAHLLLQQGRAVRILCRADSPSVALAQQGLATPAQRLIAAGAQPVAGDLKEQASLVAACTAVDTVITTANAAMRGGADTFDSVDRAGTKHLIDAARAAGVRHLIYLSAFGSSADHAHPLLQAKGQSEAALQASGLTYTILKPGPFMEGWLGAIIGRPLAAGQPVTLVGAGAQKQAFVTLRDVAAYAVATVERPAAYNRAIPLAASPLCSWTEAVAAVERVIGRSIPVRYVQPGEAIPLVPPTMSALLTALEMTAAVIDTAPAAAIYAITPTSVDDFARQFFGKQ
ncbi:MAG: SDR family oxidoreductase [Caldilinea sp. CFX5]|nr:SDR family oxidoreductase [Caldilinea sp. CFX5]